MHAAELLTARARLTPNREALYVLETDTRYTYRELSARANRLANYLRDSCGVRYGDRVSILAQNNVTYLDLFFALGKIGAVFAPLNWRLVARELAYIVQDCTPKVVFVAPEYADTWTEISQTAPVEHVIALDGASLDGVTPYTQVMAAPAAEPDIPTELNGESTYCILYTSGTTGKPKGAMLPHRQILYNAINTMVSWGLTEKDVSPVFTPLFHAGGLFAFMVPLLYAGGRIVLSTGFDPNATLQAIVDEKCTVILGVPTLFQMWRKSDVYRTADFSHVHFFISGGAPCPPSLMQLWREEKNVVFRQGYGLTEVGTNCFSMTDEESVPKTGSVGKPIFHSQMQLVGADGSIVEGPGEGELCIKGPHVTTGYWKNEAATQEALIDGWFHTGDMAKRDADGFYSIIGRAKDMLISGGENIYAAEVEAAFREHPAVEDAALIGKPDEQWGEVGLMVVLLRPGENADAETLKTHCGERLARYKIPKEVVFAESLPYSPYGKVVKATLREEYLT